MKRHLLLLLVFLTAIQPLRADEGMWLPALISQRIADMPAKGFKTRDRNKPSSRLIVKRAGQK